MRCPVSDGDFVVGRHHERGTGLNKREATGRLTVRCFVQLLLPFGFLATLLCLWDCFWRAPLLHKLPNALFSILVTILKSSSHIHTFRGHLPKGRWKKPKFCEKLFKWKLVMKKNYLEHMIYAESIASILTILVSIVEILTKCLKIVFTCKCNIREYHHNTCECCRAENE